MADPISVEAGLREKIARIISPTAFRSITERLADHEDWVARMKVAVPEYQAQTEADRMAREAYDYSEPDRSSAFRKADDIRAALSASTIPDVGEGK